MDELKRLKLIAEISQYGDLGKMLDDIDRIQSERSLYQFIKHGWRYIDPAPFVDGWHIQAVCEHLEALCRGEIRHLLINQPPRTMKSISVSVALCPWVWLQRRNGIALPGAGAMTPPTPPMHGSHSQSTSTNPLPHLGPIPETPVHNNILLPGALPGIHLGPQVSFMYASYGQALSQRDSIKSRRLIQSPFYQRNWPNVKLVGDVNTVIRFENEEGGYRIATSVGGALTGEGAECIAAGSIVGTPLGNKKIEEINIDDEVYCFDHLRGKVVISRVMQTKASIKNETYEIHTASGNTVKCTGNHPVYIEGRGYIGADKLGAGDGVRVCSGPAGIDKSDVRKMWKGPPTEIVRSEKVPQSGEPGQLLREGVLLQSSCHKEFNAVPDMWREKEQETFEILFGKMYGDSPDIEKKKKNVSSVRRRIPWVEYLLFKKMCKQDPLSENARCIKFEFQNLGKILKSIQKNLSFYKNKGWEMLRILWCTRPKDKAEWAYSFDTSGSSYQREHTGELAAESNNPVHDMSQKTPSWEVDTIISVQKHSHGEHRFYDLQVEKFNNFFAGNILVHNCIIVDDPHNTVEIESDVTREGVLQWWDEAMSTRLNDPKTGSFIVVMQRLHEKDLSGHIISKDNDDWHHLMIPMEFEPKRFCFTGLPWADPRGLDDEGDVLVGEELEATDGALLWPKRFGPEEVKALKKSMGPFAAAGQLQQMPTPRGGGIIKSSWWQTFPSAEDAPVYLRQESRWDEQEQRNITREILRYPEMEYVIAYADTAYTEAEENDYSACAVMGVWRDKNDVARLMLMKAWQGRLELHKLVQALASACVLGGKYGHKNASYVDRLVIEAKASGKSVVQEIKRLFGDERWITSEGTVKGDKVARAYSIQYLFADEMVFAPDRSWVDKVIQECSNFPKGEHDDLPDAVFGAIKWLRDNGMIEMRRERQIRTEYEVEFRSKEKPLYDV